MKTGERKKRRSGKLKEDLLPRLLLGGAGALALGAAAVSFLLYKGRRKGKPAESAGREGGEEA